MTTTTSNRSMVRGRAMPTASHMASTCHFNSMSIRGTAQRSKAGAGPRRVQVRVLTMPSRFAAAALE
eukprot:1729378-Lingulodinium_polyedra.AAC.1